jgi:hypothetical protein
MPMLEIKNLHAVVDGEISADRPSRSTRRGAVIAPTAGQNHRAFRPAGREGYEVVSADPQKGKTCWRS